MVKAKTQEEPAIEATDVVITEDSGIIPVVIAKALVKVQKDLKPLQRTSTNDEFDSKYVPLEDVMTFAIGLLNKEKIAISQPPTITEAGAPGLTTILLHESGAMYRTTTKIAIARADPQAHASSITYMRRKALESILGITSDGEDDDGNSASGKYAKPTADQIDQIRALCMDLKFPKKEVASRLWNVKTRDHASLAIRNLNDIVSQRERDNDARDRATEEEFGPSSTGGTSVKVTQVQDDLEVRMTAVGLKTKLQRRRYVYYMTKRPFLEKCSDVEREAISRSLDRIESGSATIPDFLLNSQDESDQTNAPLSGGDTREQETNDETEDHHDSEATQSPDTDSDPVT